MTLSANDDIVAYYTKIDNQLYAIVGFILVSIGSVGALLSCIVFAQKTIRKNPSSVYFLAFNLVNLFIVLAILLPMITAHISTFNFLLHNVPLCKISFYLSTLFLMLSRYYLNLVAFDRVLVTSSNALLRQRSTHRLAYWSILGVTFVIVLYHIHLLVGTGIVQIYPGYYICSPKPGNYTIFVFYSNFLVAFLLPLLLSIVFAILTLKNLQRVRIAPVIHFLTPRKIHRSRDRQFTIMVLFEILVYVIVNSPTLIRNIYIVIKQSNTEDVHQQGPEQFLQNISRLLLFILPATSFYVYMAVSKTFRKKAMQLLCK